MTGVVPNGAATSAASNVDASFGSEFADMLGQKGMETGSEENVDISETSADFANPMAALPVMFMQPASNQLVIDLPLTQDAAEALLSSEDEAGSDTAFAELATAEIKAPVAPVVNGDQTAEAAEAADLAVPVVASPVSKPELTLPIDTPVADDTAPLVMTNGPGQQTLPVSDEPAVAPHAERQSAPASKVVADAEPARADAQQPEPVEPPLAPTITPDDAAVRDTEIVAERLVARATTPPPATLGTLPTELARKYTADGRLISETVEQPAMDAAPSDKNSLKATASETSAALDAAPKEGSAKGVDAAPVPAVSFAPSSDTAEVMEVAPQALEAAQSETTAALDAKGSQLSQATVRTTADLAAAMVSRLGQRTTRFDMILTPETLGNVEVSIEVGDDGQMSARLAFENPQAANELRARADELRRQLTEAGFDVSEKSLEFTDRESDPRGGFNQFMSDSRSGRRAFMGAARLAEMADTPVAPVWTPLNLARTGVDMKV